MSGSSAKSTDHRPAGSILAIDQHSVHRICSGQVVLNLATAVKELVENSLDAGATSIDIRLKEYGSKSLEVSDNGSGVDESNFKGLTLKHHTSKLKDFSDLLGVDTFGFRGEALSSLCALGKLSILTCHQSTNIGTRLEYDHDGQLILQAPTPRECGTTVCVQNIFSTLPVRHKEFQRNLKKEFAKMVQVLNAYCIISTGVRISCTNQVGKGKKSIIACTNGNENIKDNIVNIFGSKQVESLLKFAQLPLTDEICEEYGLKLAEEKQDLFKITGYVSSSEHGQGRSSSDRQFFFINKRPCDPAKISRTVNEVYHMYNRSQYPFISLDITLDKVCVDVNVTPDKRLIFLQEEKLLQAILKVSLIHMFQPQSSSYAVNQLGNRQQSLTAIFKKSHSVSLLPENSHSNPGLTLLDSHACSSSESVKNSLTSTLANLKRSFSSAFANTASPTKQPLGENKQCKLDTFVLRSSLPDSPDSSSEMPSSPIFSCLPLAYTFTPVRPRQNDPKDHDGTSGESSQPLGESQSSVDNTTDSASELSPSVLDLPATGPENSYTDSCHIEVQSEFVLGKEGQRNDITKDFGIPESGTTVIIHTELDIADEDIKRKEVKLKFSMENLKKRLNHSKASKREDKVRTLGFHARIAPGDNKVAEDELKKEIRKDNFTQMDILGQFNLGFIICKLNQDLFIIDQHATDEKYNFEMLQKHTVIKSQKLIHPQNLALTAANEAILLDNLDIFRKNGFDFIIDEQEIATQRVKLISMPVSQNWKFDKDDIEELIFMLSDSPGILCRPSRIRAMFASRSCRKSVMIGTALNKSEMKKLVSHMAELEQPWNCPHGRPTMRHLINLNTLPD